MIKVKKTCFTSKTNRTCFTLTEQRLLPPTERKRVWLYTIDQHLCNYITKFALIQIKEWNQYSRLDIWTPNVEVKTTL